MRCEQKTWTVEEGWRRVGAVDVGGAADLVLCFGAPGTLDDGARWADLREAHPAARIVGCSTGGEILGSEVRDDSVVAAAIDLERTRVDVARARIEEPSASREVGRTLARRMRAPWLTAVLVLSDGLRVNGSELVAGLRDELPPAVVLGGGLAGDGGTFARTIVGGDEPPEEGVVVAVGFYGEHLRARCASAGGFSAFGPERRVTRSQGNVLFELDGRPALRLYERYLGEQAALLPSSALRFPLRVQRSPGGPFVVRSILAVDRDARSMTFAGDIPEGSGAWFMRGAHEALVQGAELAASRASLASLASLGGGAGFSLLVSCVGRKLVMGQRTEDEVDAVLHALPPESAAIGFYAYGEIAPTDLGPCDLHNQTMTVTTFVEV